MAGAIVGSIVGLSAVAAACAYFFWFRPKQQATKRDRQHTIEQSGVWETGDSTPLQNHQEAKYSQSNQSAAEMASPVVVSELASAEFHEAPTNSNGFDYRQGHNSNALELPGDHEFRGEGNNA